MSTESARWPYSFVVDARGAEIGWAIVHSEIVSPAGQEFLARLRRRAIRLLGMCSDGTFPKLNPEDPIDYGALCEGWCHCFREPDQFLPRDAPRTLISGSDFVDVIEVVRRANSGQGPVPDSYDYVYVGAEEPWKRDAKGWSLARECVVSLHETLGFRGLLIGAPRDASLGEHQVLTLPLMPRAKFLYHLARARFLLVPSGLDASPRILSEALSLDVPIVVFRGILGGWKYVNRFTGEFFESAEDVSVAVQNCLSTSRQPRRWYAAHHGSYRAGRSLLAFIRTLDPAVSERSHLRLTQGIADAKSFAS
jgi:hypothetical protein